LQHRAVRPRRPGAGLADARPARGWADPGLGRRGAGPARGWAGAGLGRRGAGRDPAAPTDW